MRRNRNYIVRITHSKRGSVMFKKSKTEILKIKNTVILTFIYGQREYPEPDFP